MSQWYTKLNRSFRFTKRLKFLIQLGFLIKSKNYLIMAELSHSPDEMKASFLSLAPLSRCFCTFWCPHLPPKSILRKSCKFPTVWVGVAQKTDFPWMEVATNFFGGSGDLIESFGDGISFISITLFFDIICLA